MNSIDTSPKRLRELADAMLTKCSIGGIYDILLALASEKEAAWAKTPENINQIIYALQRQENALMSQAANMGADYGAEFPAEDAKRMREAAAVCMRHLDTLADEKEEQHHIADTCEISKPAEVPLPDPALAAVVTELFSTSPYYTADQMRQYGQACAKAARDAAFEECIKAIDDQIDPEALRLGEQCEHGMTVAVDILRAAKRGTT